MEDRHKFAGPRDSEVNPLPVGDMVKNPQHYTRLDPEPWDVVFSWYGIPGCLSHVLHYIARAGHKPGNSALSDLRKAREWLDHTIRKLGG